MVSDGDEGLPVGDNGPTTKLPSLVGDGIDSPPKST